MFKDTPEGSTHSYNDGCGIPEHNDMPQENINQCCDNQCCEKCRNVHFEKTYPEHTATYFCVNISCPCHTPKEVTTSEIPIPEGEARKRVAMCSHYLTPQGGCMCQCHKSVAIKDENACFKCLPYASLQIEAEWEPNIKDFLSIIRKQNWKNGGFLEVDIDVAEDMLRSILSQVKKEEEQRIIQRIKNMLLWSKGTVEGTRNDIIAKLTTSDKE